MAWALSMAECREAGSGGGTLTEEICYEKALSGGHAGGAHVPSEGRRQKGGLLPKSEL